MAEKRDPSSGELYEPAVDDVGTAENSTAEPDVVESNSSNYGGSALDDSHIEERVLHDGAYGP